MEMKAEKTEIAAPATDKVRVLVADDSRVIRKAINKILSSEFELVETEDGETAWEHLLKDDSIEVVVSDIEMPRLDGYSLICRIRAAEPERVRNVPIIVITGADDELTRERAFACGATDFIIKPIDGVQLLARTRAHAKLDQTTRKLEETATALEEQTAVDPLTQLHSRRYFIQRGVQDLAYAKRHNSDLSVIRIDIDNFRTIYKQHGDQVSDQILVWLAKILTATCRTEDTVARIGGGEFAILAPSSGRMEAAVLCERARTAVIAEPFKHASLSLPLTISLGLSTLGRDPGETIEELLTLAEQRMTLAKAAGGNRLGISYQEEAPKPEEAVIEQPDLETALKMLGANEGGKLLPFLPDLIGRCLPLLEFCNKKLDLGLGFAIESLKDKLSDMR
ncbi:response regulator protein [Sulfuricaulis limicola]|uniref:diguanylate cyclase n=1 Tax=Sulfuricaulis limicola TaxID=1620215 RepID=A0A1B4XEY7_9GAMM|nr:diguanylate cyclase [Sulfuricaulis limicola]BAV33367.1 response regulator protein [Sulfuricaulis limicola]